MTRVAKLLRACAGDPAWALLDQGAALAASVLSFLLLGRSLGAAGYGAFVGLYALIGPLLALSQSGVFLAALEHIVREREDPGDVARSCLSMTAVIALVCVPVLSAASLRWIEGIAASTALLLIGAEFCLNGVLFTCAGVVQAQRGFAAAARLRIAAALSRVGLLATLALAGSLTLATLALGQVATLGAVMLFALTRVSGLPGVEARPGRIRPRHVRSALLYGLGIGASIVQADGDKFVLNAAHHQADAGRYGAAYRLMLIAMLPISALVGATHLSFLQAGDGAGGQVRRAVRLSLVALAYAVPAVVVLVLLAPLVPRFLTAEFAETTLILRLLVPVVILRGVGVFPMNGLMGLGRNDLRTKLLVAHALLSLALYVALIPAYSWRGALAATLVSEVSLCASGWIALLACERRGGREAGAAGEPAPGPGPAGAAVSAALPAGTEAE
jgi:O-antigen/teichoic acid export membrane protein